MRQCITRINLKVYSKCSPIYSDCFRRDDLNKHTTTTTEVTLYSGQTLDSFTRCSQHSISKGLLKLTFRFSFLGFFLNIGLIVSFPHSVGSSACQSVSLSVSQPVSQSLCTAVISLLRHLSVMALFFTATHFFPRVSFLLSRLYFLFVFLLFLSLFFSPFSLC